MFRLQLAKETMAEYLGPTGMEIRVVVRDEKYLWRLVHLFIPSALMFRRAERHGINFENADVLEAFARRATAAPAPIDRRMPPLQTGGEKHRQQIVLIEGDGGCRVGWIGVDLGIGRRPIEG